MTNPPIQWAQVPAPVNSTQGVSSLLHRVTRQPIYDREFVGGENIQTHFFVDCRKFKDGKFKTMSDTNMSLCGQLGMPTMYDLVQVAVYPTSGDPKYAERYHKFVHSDAVLHVIFGQMHRRCSVPIALMTPKGQSTPYIRDSATGKLYQIVVTNGKVDARQIEYGVSVASQVAWEMEPLLTPRTHSLLTRHKDGFRVQRIDSVDSFHVEIASKTYGVAGEEIDIFVAFEGWLMSGVM